MSGPWKIYDALLAGIPKDVRVETVNQGLQWTRVINSADGIGMALTMPAKTRPELFPEASMAGSQLCEVAGLIKSWNQAEATIGQAAINSWYSHPATAQANGFVATGTGLTWGQVFDPYAEAVSGKQVAVIGHFPFASAALEKAGELYILERNLQAGDYPDSACEYLLPECDFVFITGSSFANRTAPRLIELAKNAHTVLVGPSTPLNPVLFDYGVDTITGFVSPEAEKLDRALAGVNMTGMMQAGYRVHRHKN